jgi:hypothetical protein
MIERVREHRVKEGRAQQDEEQPFPVIGKLAQNPSPEASVGV